MRAITSVPILPALLLSAVSLSVTASAQTFPPHLFEHPTPYTAEYRITHTQRLADGNLIDLESKEVVAVDSQHRRMTAKTGTLIPGGNPLGTRVFVFDPVARTTSIWTSPGQRATVNAMPEPGAPRGVARQTRPEATWRILVPLGFLGLNPS